VSDYQQPPRSIDFGSHRDVDPETGEELESVQNVVKGGGGGQDGEEEETT
jgi:hypothetical protein